MSGHWVLHSGSHGTEHMVPIVPHSLWQDDMTVMGYDLMSQRSLHRMWKFYVLPFVLLSRVLGHDFTYFSRPLLFKVGRRNR